MRIVYFQGVGGASGDMILGALAALGVDMDQVQAAVASLATEPIRILRKPFESHGLNGIQATVDVDVHDHDHHHDHDLTTTTITTMITTTTIPTTGTSARSAR